MTTTNAKPVLKTAGTVSALTVSSLCHCIGRRTWLCLVSALEVFLRAAVASSSCRLLWWMFWMFCDCRCQNLPSLPSLLVFTLPILSCWLQNTRSAIIHSLLHRTGFNQTPPSGILPHGRAMALRLLVADLSPWRFGLSIASARVGSVVDKVALGQVFSDFFGISCQYRTTMAVRIHVSPVGWTVGPLVAAVQRHSLTPLSWTSNKYLSAVLVTICMLLTCICKLYSYSSQYHLFLRVVQIVSEMYLKMGLFHSKIRAFWDIVPCILVVDRRFKGSTHVWNVGLHGAVSQKAV
jgi:hypothetical protein